MYYDGANLNPVLCACRPGGMRFDVMHINLHETFSTPHGGGGPGAGPVGVRVGLEQFLPVASAASSLADVKAIDFTNAYGGKISVGPYHGNYGVLLRALSYILTFGRED